jgi:hypothetical protein
VKLPDPVLVKFTGPPGADTGVALVSVTVAVQVLTCPVCTEAGAQLTAVDVASASAGSSTTCLLPLSAVYTSPAESTATPIGWSSPVNGSVTCWLELVAPAGNSTT